MLFKLSVPCGNLSFSGVHSVNDLLERLEIGASLSALQNCFRHLFSLGRLPSVQKAFLPLGKEKSRDDSLDRFLLKSKQGHRSGDDQTLHSQRDEITMRAAHFQVPSAVAHARHERTEAPDEQQIFIKEQCNSPEAIYRTLWSPCAWRSLPPLWVALKQKSQIPGMVHDQSSSGSKFLFSLEPMAVVNLNNKYKKNWVVKKKKTNENLRETWRQSDC